MTTSGDAEAERRRRREREDDDDEITDSGYGSSDETPDHAEEVVRKAEDAVDLIDEVIALVRAGLSLAEDASESEVDEAAKLFVDQYVQKGGQ